MKGLSLKTYSLFLSIILWGVLIGGVVYSHMVYFPVYLSDLPDSSILVTGKYALHEERFWMTVHPLLVLSLIVTTILNWKFKPRRKLILLSFGVYVLILIVSSLYFIPELIVFRQSAASGISAADWLARANRWQYLSWIRGAFCIIFFVPLLGALTRSESKSEVPQTV